MSAPRLHIDYVVTPRPRRWAGLLLLAAALAVAGHLGSRYRAVQLDLERVTDATDLASMRARAPRPVPKARLDEQVKNAESVVRQLALPWALLIRTLEESAIEEVALLQLQPEAQQQVLKITAEARDEVAMLEYLRRLARSKALVNVHLVSHQLQPDSARYPLQFSAQAGFEVSHEAR